MKKVLAITLSLLLALSCVLLVACNSTVTALKIDNAPSQVKRNSTVDYSQINVVATLEDGTTETLPLTDDAVSFTPIDTSTTGNKTLTASYGGKSAQATIKVVLDDVNLEDVVISEFNNTDGYNAYLEAIKTQTNKETEFFVRDAGYTVGNVNGYRFVPVVTAVSINDMEEVDLSESQIHTNFTLYRLNGTKFEEIAEQSLATFLSKVENNTYYFTSAAEHETFKLVVTLDEGFNLLDDELNTTVEQVFTVVDGYNAYDVLGLSVLDNLNIKSWSDIKNTTTLDWDNNKKLSEFTDVKQVILHNNINITVNDLPANYFWQENEAAQPGGSISYSNAFNATPEKLRPYLTGSLKEIYLGEDWENKSDAQQRGLFVSNGIGLNGNYLQLTYEDNLDAAGAKSGAKGIYVVHDWNQKEGQTLRTYPESHWSIISYQNTGNTSEPVVENVYFAGQTGKSDNTELPAGLMMMYNHLSNTTINNSIGAYWYANITMSGEETSININDCKLYDSFSQMVYSRHTVEINITNSEMKRAGGPIFIVITNEHDTHLNIDSTANMESWVTGSEMWFAINMGEGASIVSSLLETATLPDGSVNTHYAKTLVLNGDSYTAANLIAIVIPNAGDVLTNQKAIQGTINIDEVEYGMNEAVFNALISLNAISSTGSSLAQTTLQALDSSLGAAEKQQLNALKSGFEGLAAIPYAPVYKCGSAYAFASFDNQNQLVLNSFDGIKSLYGGCLLVQQLLLDAAAQYETAMPETAAQLQALAAQWGQLAATANLTTVAGAAAENDEAWAASWTAGQLAFWVNPAAMGQQGNKHFMVLIGEGAQA